MADTDVLTDVTPAAKATKAVKDFSGWFRAKEDCYLGGTYGFKKDGEVFFYEGTPHDSLVGTKAPKQQDED